MEVAESVLPEDFWRKTHLTSMEPRLGSRGKLRTPNNSDTSRNDFNGAATWKSRKDVERAKARIRLYNFNGAATWKSRKVCDEVGRSASLANFNGAATWKSRKELDPAELRPAQRTSMEPRLGSRGKQAMPCGPCCRAPYFNGAATWKSRKGQGGWIPKRRG